MNLLFLDVDGVLNSHDFSEAAMCGPIHADKERRLNGVLILTGAKVVLSSAWRYLVHRDEMNLTGLDWLLRSHGLLAGRLIGVTGPDTMVERPHWDGSTPWPHTNERGEQIRDWLTANPAERVAVVDDLDLGITAVGLPLVLTDGKVGLTEADAEKLVAILSDQPVETA